MKSDSNSSASLATSIDQTKSVDKEKWGALSAAGAQARQRITMWHEAPIEQDGCTTYSVTLEMPDSSRQKLWYKIRSEHAESVTANADPFVVGSIFIAMHKNMDLLVHSQVSPTLLRNLVDFQNAWWSWCPNEYGRIDITADREIESSAANNDGSAVCAFSCGLDSLFTVYRHCFVPIGRQKRNIGAAMLMRGFDEPIANEVLFQQRADRCKRVLDTVDIPLIAVETNFKEINPAWIHSHGAGLASCLMLLQNRFTEGIIASTYPLTNLLLPWGSNPITDVLLSSRSFQTIHDAGHWSRSNKLMALQVWPDAYNNLTVCYSNDRKDENCCRCFKCLLTLISIKACQLPPCSSFAEELTEESILSLRNLQEFELFGMDEFVKTLRGSSMPKSLVRATERCISYNKKRVALENQNARLGWPAWGKVLLRLHKLNGI